MSSYFLSILKRIEVLPFSIALFALLTVPTGLMAQSEESNEGATNQYRG